MNTLQSARAPHVLALLLTVVGLFWTAPVAAQQGQDFFTIDPCRQYDSRGGAGPFVQGSTHEATLTGAPCGVPANATVVAINVTIIAPGTGDLMIYPTGATPPSGSPPPDALSFNAGRTTAKNFLVALGTGGQVSFKASYSSPGLYHVVLDIAGYFESAPKVVSTTPADGASGVALNSNIVINFSENVNVTASAFELECPAGNPVAFAVTPASPANSFTLDPTADLPAGVTCTVTVVATEVTDTDGDDPPDAMEADYVFSFSTFDTAPSVQSTTPTDGATGVALSTNITVQFSENVDVTASAFTLECPVGSPVAFTVTPVPPGGTNSFTLDPSSDLPNGVVCTAKVIANQVADTDTIDPPNNMAGDYTFTFTPEAFAPVVTTTAGTTVFTEGGGPVTVDAGVTVTDSDSANLASATVTITNPQDGAAEVLAATSCAGLTVTPGLNSLSITDSQPIATYQTCLQSVTYDNSSQNPGTTPRVISFVANDGTSSSAAATKTVTVGAVNNPPTIDPIADPAAINEDAGLQTVNLTGISAGGSEVQPLQVTAVSDNTAVIPHPTVIYTSPNAMGSLQYTPVADAFGTANITVTVTDGGLDGNLGTAGDNGTTTDVFQVVVDAVNDPPTLDPIADPAAINEDAGLQTVNLTGITAGDAETQPLQVTAVSDNTAVIPHPTVIYTTPNATGSLQYTPVADASGTANITVTVTDGGLDGNLGTAGDNGTTTDVFQVVVNAVNDAPTLNPIADPAAINEDAGLQTVNLTGITAGDAESQPLQVTAVSDNTAVIPHPTVIYTTPNATGSLQYTPVAGASGTANITVTVTDGGLDGNLGTAGDNGTTTDVFQVVVNAVNDTPTLDPIPDPAAINEDAGLQTVNLSGISAGDAETQPLQVTAVSDNTALIPHPTVIYTSPNATGSLQYTPVNDAFGTANITVTVTDGGLDGNLGTAGDNGTTTDVFQVVVNAVNDAPFLTPIPDPAAINEDAPLQTVNINGITAGPGEGTQPLMITAVSDNTAVIPNPTVIYTSPNATGSLQYTPVANAFGTANITVTLTDGGNDNNLGTPGDNLTFIDVFQVIVNSVNDLPVAVDDIFDTIGNTELRVDLAAAATPHVLETTPSGPLGVLRDDPALPGNQADSDPIEGSPISIVSCTGDASAPFNCTTVNGGSVALGTDGTFSYTPPAGHGAASDSFQYTISDGTDTDTATVTINRLERVWYVDPAAGGGGNGTSASPFNTLDALDGGADSDQPSDYIFVYGGTLALSGPMPMEANQHLIGHGHVAVTMPSNFALSIPVNLNGNGSPTNLIPTGIRPQLTNASGNTVTVTTEIPIEIVGLSLAGGTTAGGGSCGSPTFACNAIDLTTAAALSGSSTLTIRNNELRGAGAEGIDVNLNASTTGTLTLNVTNNSWNTGGTHTGNAVDINRAAGTLRLDFSNNTSLVSANVAGAAVNINGGAAASTTITGFSGNTVHQNTAGSGIFVSNATFDATPGGTLDQVSAGTTSIGILGNGAGGAGLVMSAVTGDLQFGSFSIYADGGAGLSVAGTGSFTGAAGTRIGLTGLGDVEAIGGPAANLSNLTAALTLNMLKSTNSASTGVNLAGVAGTFSAPSSSSITNAGTTDFAIDSTSAAVTYNGTITDDVGQLVSVSNSGGSLKSFTGAITDGDDGDGSGISLTGNSSTIRFSGGVTLSTGANPAFTATGGGTVEVCDENPCNPGATGLVVNKITTTTGTALNVANTGIGSNRLEFRSISSNGGGNSSIVLNSTCGGASCNTAVGFGGLTVSGNGGSCASAATCTGGAIQNKTVDGISLNNTRSVSLTRMFIDNNDGSGIFGDDVTDFSLISSQVTNNADTATGAEAGLRFNELLGNCAITNSTITGSSEDNIRITPASGVLSQLTISGGSIGFNSAATGGHGVSLIGTGTAQATMDITGVTFESNRSSGVIVNITDTGNFNVSVSNSIFRDDGAAVTLQTSSSADLTFDVLNNTEIVRSISNAIQLVAGSNSTPSSEIRGTISGNVVGNGTADSGSRDMFGIALDLRGDQDSIIAVNNNNVRNSDFEGIWVSSADFGTLAGPSAKLDLTLRDNTVGAPDDNSGFPVGLIRGVLVDGRHTTTVCLDMFSNTSAGIGGGEHFRLRQRDTSTFQLERLSDGDGTPNELLNNVATVESHIVAQSDPGSTADATLVNGFFEAANGTCRKP